MRYFKKIIGENLYLSPINKDDVEIYTEWLNDKEVSGYLGNYSSTISLKYEQEFLDKMALSGHNFAIVLLQNDKIIGNISLFDINHINRNATVGIFIGDSENRSKGYGSEALKLIVNYGFKTLNLHNIMLTVHSDNPRGIACYQKVGFNEFGRRRESNYKDGHYVDQVYMEILDC